MIKYLFLVFCTMFALLIKDYVASVSVYVVGLVVYESLVITSIIKKRKNESISSTNTNL